MSQLWESRYVRRGAIFLLLVCAILLMTSVLIEPDQPKDIIYPLDMTSVQRVQVPDCPFPDREGVAKVFVPEAVDAPLTYSPEYQQPDYMKCDLAYLEVSAWPKSDPFTSENLKQKTVLLWKNAEGGYLIQPVEEAEFGKGTLFITAQVEGDSAAFYFLRQMPKHEIARAAINRDGNTTLTHMPVGSEPKAVTDVMTTPEKCGLMSKWQVMDHFFQTYTVPPDLEQVAITAMTQPGSWEVLNDNCQSAYANVWLEGPMIGYMNFSYYKTVTYFWYTLSSGKTVVSDPLTEEYDAIRYSLASSILGDTLYEYDWYTNGETHRVQVNSTGKVTVTSQFKWIPLIQSAMSADYDPHMTAPNQMPFTFRQVALLSPNPSFQMPDPYMDIAGWIQAQFKAEVSFEKWRCVNPDCNVMMLRINGSPEGRKVYAHDFNFTVFAFVDAAGQWKLTNFVESPGSPVIYGLGMTHAAGGAIAVSSCLMNGGDTDLVITYTIQQSGSVVYSRENEKCPETAILPG